MKQNNTHKLLTVAMLALLSLGSCTKDTVTLRGKISHYSGGKADAGCGEKVYLDGSTPRWHYGDTLKINEDLAIVSTTDGSTATVSVPRASHYTAVYPSSIATDLTNLSAAQLTLPRLQVYREDASGNQIVATPMCASSSGSTLNFKNMGALLAIRLTNGTNHASLTIDSISVKSVAYGTPNAPATAMWGAATADLSSASPSYTFTTSPTAGANDSVTLARAGNESLNIVLGNNEAQSKTVYVYVPAIGSSADNLFCIRIFARNGNVGYTYLRSQTASGSGNVGRNQKAEVPFSMLLTNERKFVDGAVNGLFTVNASGGKVYFSKGNLQYKKEGTHAINTDNSDNIRGGTWRFAENQWEYTGSSANYSSLAQDTWFDLFGWGMSGNVYGPDYFSTNCTGYTDNVANTRYDWGNFNAISNGGNAVGIWRTPTEDEWRYLLFTRAVNGGIGAGHSYQITMVNSIWGVLIYPDGYTQQGNYSTSSNPSTVPAGCVFLPTAGYRRSTDYTTSERDGYYWSSTPTARSDTRAQRVHINCADSNPIVEIGGGTKSYGLSVRLVRDDPYATTSGK